MGVTSGPRALEGTKRDAVWEEGHLPVVAVLPSSFFPASPGVEGGFDLSEEKYEYDEDVKIVILPDYLEIARDGLGGLPDIVRDRVRMPSCPAGDSGAGRSRAVTSWASTEKAGD